MFTRELNQNLNNIEPATNNCDEFIVAVRQATKLVSQANAECRSSPISQGAPQTNTISNVICRTKTRSHLKHLKQENKWLLN